MRGIRTSAVVPVLVISLLLGLAGCGDKPRKPGASGSKSGTASASAGASAGSSDASPGASGQNTPPAAGGGGTATGSDKQVCADQEKLVADSTRKFGEEIVKAASGDGGDKAAIAAVKTLFSEWAAGMRTQAGKATNADLKSALTQYATGLDKVNSQINGIEDLDKLGDLNTGEIETATNKILEICG
jgi:hypothetical protein